MILTALEPEDLELLYAIENDAAQWCVGNANVPYSRYDLRDYILNQQHDIYADKQVRLVARLHPTLTHNAVGLVDLYNFSPEHSRAEVGFAILKGHQGRGHATEAVRLLVDYARTTLRLHSLYATVPASNAASLAVLRANGFTNEQPLKDWLRTTDGWQDAIFLQRLL